MKQPKVNRILSLLIAAVCIAAVVLSASSAALADAGQEVISIRTAEEFLELAASCTLDTWSQGKKVVLEADISLSDAPNASIPTFGGTFDGNGHTISGLKITQSTTPSGLFGILQEGAVVRSLKVSGDIILSGDGGCVGGIAGENYGMVIGCTFTGNVSGEHSVGGIAGVNAATGQILACRSNGSVVGDKMTGGIAGCSLGVIQACRNNAYVNTVSVDPTLSPEDIQFDFSLDVSRLSNMDTSMAASDTGGIAGYSSGIVSGCSNCAPVGYPHTGYNAGGIVGRSCGYILDCENSADVFGRKDVGGIAGQMEPYIAQNLSESALSTLERQLDELDVLLTAALDDTNAGIGAVTSRLNRIADYMDSAAGAASSIRTSGSVTGTVTGSGEAGSGGSITVTPPQFEVEGGSGTVAGAGGGVVSGGEITGGGAGAAGGEVTEGGGVIGSGGVAGAGGGSGLGGALGGGIASGGGIQAGLTEGGAEGDHHAAADGSLSASTQITMTTNLSGLSSAISGMSGQMRLLNGEVSGVSGSLTGDLKAIQQKINEISDTAMDLLLGDGEADILIDSSDLDAELATLGKAADCSNSGSVSGDINVGGIAGAMAMEYELDPEDDITSDLDGRQRRKLEVKAIIEGCVNTGSVEAKRSYAGGVCGRMDLGLIAASEGYGSVTSESGDYVGGIAGLTGSTVRHCFAKCTLSGESYVGGIVGSGVAEDLSGGSSTVAGCYSMVSIEDCQEFAGAISGADAGAFVENYFVSDTLTGINGRSYTGRAEPISYAELFALEQAPAEDEAAPEAASAEDGGQEEPDAQEEDGEEKEAKEPDEEGDADEADGGDAEPEEAGAAQPERISIPDAFLQLTLTFVADGEVIERIPFAYGDSFVESVFPDIPEKEGHYACWDSTELRDLHFDTVVTAVYTPYVTALSNAQTRADGRPILFVEGLFDDGAAVGVTAMPNTPQAFPFLASGWSDVLARSFSGQTVSREIVEQWRLSIPDDGQDAHTVRYLSPSADPDHLDIYVKGTDGWRKAEAEAFGSYLVFTVEGQEAEIAAISTQSVWWVWLIAGLLLLLLLALLVCLVRRLVRTRRKAPAQAAGGEPDGEGSEPDAAAGEMSPAHAPKKRRRWLMPLLIVLALLTGIVGTAAFFLLPGLLRDVRAYDLLKDCAEKQELTMALTVEGTLGSRDIGFTAALDRTEVDCRRVTAIEQDGRTLCYCDGTVFLENGSAYRLSDAYPDASQLLELTMELYRHVDVEETDGTYAITAQGADARAILELLLPSAAGQLADANALQVQLYADGNEVTRIRFDGNGTLNDGENTAFALSAELALRPGARDRVAIPEAVRSAISGGEYAATEVLTDDLLRMANAWLALDRAQFIDADLLLKADCGPVTLDDRLDFYRWNDGGTNISSVQKNGYALYFTDTAVCDRNGAGISAADASSVEAGKLLDIAYQACLNAQADCSRTEDAYTYTLSLDAGGMEAVAFAIAPAAEGMELQLDSGSIRVEIRDDRIRRIELRCGGTARIVLSTADVAFEAQMDFADEPDVPELPEAVRSVLEK